MLRWFSALSLAAATAWAAPAAAQNWGSPSPDVKAADGMLTRVSVEQFSKVLQDAGYRAEIVRNKDKRPYIRTGLSGRRVTVYMYDCKEETCGSFQYSVVFNKDAKWTVEYSNAWNTKRRYSKTYVDKDGDMNLEWDIDMDGGVTGEFLKQSVLSFERYVAEFDKFTP